MQISKATRLKAQMAPAGVGGLKLSSGKVEEEFLDELQWPDAGKIYQEMSSNDAVVGGCLYLIETLARRADWVVKPATKEAGDIEAAEFLESCMHDMKGQPWDAFICDALSMLVYGFSFHEIVYKTRRGPQERDSKLWSKFTDGKIGWQGLPVRSQASLDQWVADENTGVIQAFRQDPGLVGLNAQTKDIPIEGNLLFVTRANRGNPEGWSILRRAYRSWYFKRYIEELEGIGIERGLAGIPVLAPPPDVNLFDRDNEQMVTMLNWSQDLVQELRQDRNHGVVLPNTDWKLTLLGIEGRGTGIDTDKIIRRHEYRIASSMLSDLILIGADSTGSFSLAETKQSTLINSLQTICNSIASVLNDQAVPTLFALNNWNLEKFPSIVVEGLRQPTASDVALILRSFKTDFTRNQKLFNYLLTLIQAPQLTEEEYNEFMANQPADGKAAGTDDDFQDSSENDAKQSNQLTR